MDWIPEPFRFSNDMEWNRMQNGTIICLMQYILCSMNHHYCSNVDEAGITGINTCSYTVLRDLKHPFKLISEIIFQWKKWHCEEGLQPAFFIGQADHLCFGIDMQLIVNVGDMFSNGKHTEMQRRSDPLGIPSAHHHL